MTLQFQGYDQSPEFHQFVERVNAAQGFISGFSYPRGHNATIELTAFVPEQPELIQSNEIRNHLH